jgi:hypothetical protein
VSSTRLNHYRLSFPHGGESRNEDYYPSMCSSSSCCSIQGIWQIIVIRSKWAWWQPLSWSKRALWQPLSCSIIVTLWHWYDRQCWRSQFNVKMLWCCTTQNDRSWSLFNVDEGKFLPPLSTRWWGSRRVLYRTHNLMDFHQHMGTTSTSTTTMMGKEREVTSSLHTDEPTY